MDNFVLAFPEDAERLDFASLPEEIQQALGEGIAQNPAKHAVYRFCLLAKALPNTNARTRERRRRSYQRADRVVINLMTSTSQVRLLGIYPPAETLRMNSSGEGEVSAGFTTPLFSINLRGLLKDLARRRGQRILAGRTGREAQWIFLKPYLEEHTDFCLTFLLQIPADLLPEAKFVWCEAAVTEKGRLIQKHRRRKILLSE
jgi:hypothetical protein